MPLYPRSCTICEHGKKDWPKPCITCIEGRKSGFKLLKGADLNAINTEISQRESEREIQTVASKGAFINPPKARGGTRKRRGVAKGKRKKDGV